jgi:prefoldin beta subunit
MAQMQMSPQMENQIAQFQQIQQQLQMVASQRVQLEAQTKELEKAIETLAKAAPDVPVYKSIGSILVKGENRDKVKSELEEQKETLNVRITTSERQETHRRERYQNLQQQLTKALTPKVPGKESKPKSDEEEDKDEK